MTFLKNSAASGAFFVVAVTPTEIASTKSADKVVKGKQITRHYPRAVTHAICIQLYDVTFTLWLLAKFFVEAIPD